MSEIGSEFSYTRITRGMGIQLLQNITDYTFTFSGRTAIETVLFNEPQLKNVMLPSYCCDSMIDPFRRKDISIKFYDVSYKKCLKMNISELEDVDAIVICNYFGYTVNMPELDLYISKGGIVIEDITHSFYSNIKHHFNSGYLVASIRKWEGVICGGYCASIGKKLKYKPQLSPPDSFVDIKKEAMMKKQEYLVTYDYNLKDYFLSCYSKANTWLANNYTGLTIDEYSLNLINTVNYNEHRSIRRKNAKYLHKYIKKNKYINFLFNEEALDCPLFVPVVVDKKYRNSLRNYLAKNGIYCPIHWPVPNMDCESNLYSIELSIVCDHRYDVEHMKYIANTINLFFEGEVK